MHYVFHEVAVDNSYFSHKKARLAGFLNCGKIRAATTRCSVKRGFFESPLLILKNHALPFLFSQRNKSNRLSRIK